MSNKILKMNLEIIDRITHQLRQLMQSKNISEAELARKTGVPQPTLHKILAGTTSDPRASTLKLLADFFDVSVDELLADNFGLPLAAKNNAISMQAVPILSWSDCIDSINFLKNLSPSTWSNWAVSEYFSKQAYALISKPSMEPRFPKKTILLINPEIIPEDGDLVIVQYPSTQEATLRELSIDGPIKLLLSLNTNCLQNDLNEEIKIHGVVVKSVFTFH